MRKCVLYNTRIVGRAGSPVLVFDHFQMEI